MIAEIVAVDAEGQLNAKNQLCLRISQRGFVEQTREE